MRMAALLGSQRHLFDLPADVAYLNSASMGLLPIASREAARELADRKARPWAHPDFKMAAVTERARRAAAGLIGASPDDIAHVPSVGLAVAQAGRLIDIAKGARVLVMEDDHASPVFEWVMRAQRGGYSVETVRNPGDGDWTAAILEAIERPHAAPLALLSVSTIHWTEGCLIDVAAISAAARRQGARVLLDATQTIGVVPFDVAALDPDFVTFVCYKWLCGPHGRSFLYVAKRHQGGMPLDQTMSGRRNVRAEAETYFADTRYVDNARRFDIGQRETILSMDLAAMGMEYIAGLGAAAVGARVGMLTRRLADGIGELPGLSQTPAAQRSPHILSVRPTAGPMPAAVAERMAARGTHSCIRLGRLRLAPHIYNDEADIDRCLADLRASL
jgi:selenocysteine lyase/cysteine desulfurase